MASVQAVDQQTATESSIKIQYCNLCGHDEHRLYCPENGRGLVQCSSCGLVFVQYQPAPDKLYQLYDNTYFQSDDSGEVGYTDYISDEQNIRLTANRRLDHLAQYTDGGALLDVGCAMGFFIDEAAKRGWQVEGLDVSSFATRYVSERFNHPSHNMSLLDLDPDQQRYDLITLYDVIEHVPDPRAYVEHIAALLNDGGVIELATPDIHSLPARITGKRWIGYKLSEEHVYYFSEATLRRLLTEADFEVIHTRHIGKHVTLSLFFDRLGFYVPPLAKLLERVVDLLGLSKRSLYVNPFDIIAVTARKKS